MASIKELKKQIEDVNALGIKNLSKKGVELSEASTTCEIMQGIEQISGGGASLNIAYGETPPEDTSKLWIKANEPDKITFKKAVEGVDSIDLLDAYLPQNRYDMCCARVGTKIYAFGGHNGSSRQNSIYMFDTEAETITALKVTLPAVRTCMGCASVGSKIYLFGGENKSGIEGFCTQIYEFDTETEAITTLDVVLPYRCSAMGCVTVGTKVYLIGGRNYSKSIQEISVFDTATKTITKTSAMLPDGIAFMGCDTIGTKIYLFGGYDASLTGYDNTIYVFDTETETITTLSTTLPKFMGYMSCARIGAKFYLFGGYSKVNGGYLDTIYEFDSDTESVTTLDATLPKVCCSTTCASTGNKIYLFGGNNNGSAINTINVFTISYELIQGNIDLQSSFTNNIFKLINTDTAQIEVGVENVYIGNENNEAELCEAYLHNGAEWVRV